MMVTDLYPRLLTGLTEDNMTVIDLYPRLLMGPIESYMIVTDLYPRLLTGPIESNEHCNFPKEHIFSNEIKYVRIIL